MKYKDSKSGVKSGTRINNTVWQDAKWSRHDRGVSCNKFMGQVVTDFKRLINADLLQNGSLHLFYILNFFFRTLRTQIYASNRALYLLDILSKQLVFLSMLYRNNWLPFKSIV